MVYLKICYWELFIFFLLGFECRCGNVYCGFYRYFDKYNCSFDYKVDGRVKILKDNFVVVGLKI